MLSIAAFHDVLSFRGQKLHACDKGEISPLLAGILGAVAQGFLEDLKVKIKRGLRGRVLAGMSAGGLGYGYSTDPARPGTREIVQFEADLVRRIFILYASGMPPRSIAAKLNADGIPGPGGRLWGDTTIRGQVHRGTGILNNAAYVGRLEWNRCSYTRHPSTGHRVARPNPARGLGGDGHARAAHRRRRALGEGQATAGGGPHADGADRGRTCP